MGLIYGDLGNLEKAIDYDLKALRVYEDLKDTLQVAGMQLNVAMVYSRKDDHVSSEQWLYKSLGNFKLKKSKLGEAYVYNNLAIANRHKHQFDKTLEYYMKSLKLKEELKDSATLGQSYMNLGLTCEDLEDFEKAHQYYEKAIGIFKRGKNLKGFAGVYVNLGTLLISEGKIEEGKKLLLSSLDYSMRIHSKEDEVEARKNLAVTYEQLGDYVNALKQFRRYREIKDTMMNESGARQIALLQSVYETDKKDQELEVLKTESQLKDEQLSRDNLIITFAVFILVLSSALVILLLYRFRLRKKTNKILADKHNRINTRKKEITDSIFYARRIQESILPRSE